MAYVWTVCLVQWAAGGTATITDATTNVDLVRSEFGGDARAETDIRHVVFTLYEGQALTIDSFMHIWAGWRDDTTHAWDSTRRPYAGIIIDHEGFMEAGEHLLDCTCVGYSDYGSTTRVKGFPVVDPNADQTGVAPGFTVAQWVSGAGVPGLLTSYFAGPVDVQVVIQPGVGDIVLDAAHLPGILLADYEIDAPAGAFGFVYVSDVLTEILKAAHAADTTKRPLAFWRPAIRQTDSTEIVPELCIIDQNDTTGTVIATVHATTTPTSTEVVPEDTRHHRDARKSYHRIVTKGVGGDPTLDAGDPTHRHVIYAETATHASTYPDPFRTDPGRALLLLERTLATVAEAQAYADRVETQVWGPRGTLTAILYDDDLIAAGVTAGIDALEVGALLHYIDAKETLDQNYPIISVQRVADPDARRATVTFGFVPLDVQDIDVGGTGDMPWLYDGTNPFAAPTGSGGAPGLAPTGGAVGAPAPMPLPTRPSNDNHATVRPLTRDVIGLTVAGTDTAQVVSGLDTAPPAAPHLRVIPRKTLRDASVPTGYFDTYGFWQPNVMYFQFDTLDPIRLLLPGWLQFRIQQAATSDGSVTFTYQRKHTGGAFTTVTIPFDLSPLDEWNITPDSIPAAGYVLLTLTTAEFGGLHL